MDSIGTFGGHFLNFPIVFRMNEENKQKIRKYLKFQQGFEPLIIAYYLNHDFFYDCTQFPPETPINSIMRFMIKIVTNFYFKKCSFTNFIMHQHLL